jgi:hypothetical protein
MCALWIFALYILIKFTDVSGVLAAFIISTMSAPRAATRLHDKATKRQPPLFPPPLQPKISREFSLSIESSAVTTDEKTQNPLQLCFVTWYFPFEKGIKNYRFHSGAESTGYVIGSASREFLFLKEAIIHNFNLHKLQAEFSLCLQAQIIDGFQIIGMVSSTLNFHSTAGCVPLIVLFQYWQ